MSTTRESFFPSITTIFFLMIVGWMSVPLPECRAQVMPIIPDHECKWKANVTDAENLPNHKYVVLEDCLYYYLSRKADEEFGKPSSLVILPPTKNPGDTIKVTLHKATVRQMWMNEVWKEMHINGYMLVSWKDPRLTWDYGEWKKDSTRIKTFGHLWCPDIYSERYQTSVQANDFTLYQDIKATQRGNVTARLEYRMQATCEVDYTSYPADEKYCCFNLKSYLYGDIIKFDVKDQAGKLDLDRIQTNWDIMDVHISKQVDDEDNRDYIKFCVRSGRKSTTLRIELTIPIVISSVLVLISPLFGGFKSQLYVKLFALLLQFLCFQSLVDKTPQIGFGDETPRIYKFYEFTLGMTLVSLIVTLIIHAVGRLERSLPPPHSLLLTAAAINSKLCCSPKSSESGDKNKEGNQWVDDWREVFGAANNIFSVLLIVIYILAVAILLS